MQTNSADTLPTPLFARDELLQRLGGDEQAVDEIVALFLEDCPCQLENIRAALAGANLSEVEESAHTFKGSLRSLGARNLAETAQQLELLARRGDGAAARSVFAELEEQIGRLNGSLRGATLI